MDDDGYDSGYGMMGGTGVYGGGFPTNPTKKSISMNPIGTCGCAETYEDMDGNEVHSKQRVTHTHVDPLNLLTF